MSMDAEPEGLLCPSAPPDWLGATVIGIIGGTADTPRVTPLEQPLIVTSELLALSEPVLPTEVFRFAAPCSARTCQHFQDGACHLAQKIVQLLPGVDDQLPFCTIRTNCRWFRQEGRAACYRCSQVVTDNVYPGVAMRLAADPTYKVG
ncbi:MAG: nitrogen fixation protein [Acidobacteriota bacterium]|nr:nitrogen fixation protein [Acidobacteriota bacterium]